MKHLCLELNQLANHYIIQNCVLIDDHRFLLILLKENRQKALFFSFATLFSRFHLKEDFKPFLKNSQHPLFKFLSGALFRNAHLINEDRILQLTLETENGLLFFIGEFFSKHPNYYLVDANQTILFSLYPAKQKYYQLPPQIIHQKNLTEENLYSHFEIEQIYSKIEQERAFTETKKNLLKKSQNNLKKFEKKALNLSIELDHASKWRTIQHEGDLIKANLGVLKKRSTSLVWDWLNEKDISVTIPHDKSPVEFMEEFFKRAKKLQRSLIHLNKQLELTHKKIEILQISKNKIESASTMEELIPFGETQPPISSAAHIKSISKKVISNDYIEYQSEKGLKIWVGRNAKTNERLTFQLANGRDWWLHTKDLPGSHVIIRLGKDKKPDKETVEDAKLLALLYSKAKKHGEAEVIYTECKYVTRSSKNRKPGQVQVSKHHSAWVKSDITRHQALKERL